MCLCIEIVFPCNSSWERSHHFIICVHLRDALKLNNQFLVPLPGNYLFSLSVVLIFQCTYFAIFVDYGQYMQRQKIEDALPFDLDKERTYQRIRKVKRQVMAQNFNRQNLRNQNIGELNFGNQNIGNQNLVDENLTEQAFGNQNMDNYGRQVPQIQHRDYNDKSLT